MRMLAVDERFDAIRRLSGLQQQWVAGLAHQWIEREHASQRERSSAQHALGHAHDHAFAEGLIVSAPPALMVVNQRGIAMEHRRPIAEDAVNAFHA
jgi:hypothetical protein